MKKPKSTPIKTILVISMGFLIVYLITQWKWAVYITLTVGLIGIVSDYLSKKLDFLWMKLTWILSFIVPNVLLTLVFYLLLFPIAVLSRLFGEKDPLRLKNTTNSIFKNSNKKFDKVSFEKPW
jgi:hypothetical protein